MITVVAKNFVQPNKTQEFLSLAKQLVEATTTKDAGCIRYELLADTQNANVFSFVEQWQDKPSLDKHMATDHFQNLFPKMGALCTKEADISIYQPAL